MSFIGVANIQNLIDTLRKRLCYQASKETREYAEQLKKDIHEVEPEISNVLVPNCVYRCGCPELVGCGYWKNFVRYCNDTRGIPNIAELTIQERYDLYNDYFYSLTGH